MKIDGNERQKRMSKTPITDMRSVGIIGFYSCATVPTHICKEIKESRNELLELVTMGFDRFTDNDMQPANHELSLWLKRTEEAIKKAKGE